MEATQSHSMRDTWTKTRLTKKKESEHLDKHEQSEHDNECPKVVNLQHSSIPVQCVGWKCECVSVCVSAAPAPLRWASSDLLSSMPQPLRHVRSDTPGA